MNPMRRMCIVFTLIVAALSGLAAQADDDELTLSAIRAEEEFSWGVRAYQNGFFNEALLAFTRSLGFRPEDALTRIWLGKAYYRTGFVDAALEEWQAVLGRGLNSPYLENLVTTIRVRQGLGPELSRASRFVAAARISGTAGESPLFRNPASVLTNRDGSSYVVSFATHEIVQLDANGERIRVIEGGLAAFDAPFAVYEDPSGFLFVSEFGGDRIAKVNRRGNKVLTFGGTGVGRGNLLGPQHIDGDGNGFIFVSDWGNGRVSKFDTDGNFVLAFGGNGRLRRPTGLAVTGDRVYVADAQLRRISIFDHSGNFISHLAEGRLESPEGLSVVGEGRLAVADGSRVLILDVERELLSEAFRPSNSGARLTSARLDANGNMLVTDFAANELYVLTEARNRFTSLHVQVDRVIADSFPSVFAEVRVERPDGSPVVGLEVGNFRVTESRSSVGEPSLVYTENEDTATHLAIMAERSREFLDYQQVARQAVESIFASASGEGSFRVVSAGATPSLESERGEGSLTHQEAAASRGVFGPGWAFDLGLRFAGGELIGLQGKPAVVFLSTGTVPDSAFRQYTLQVLADFLIANDIGFHVVYLRPDRQSPELEFLADASGGSSRYAFAPEGLGSLVADVRERPSGSYILNFESRSNSDFGREYIPLEIESYFIQSSGRAESGYFAPLEF